MVMSPKEKIKQGRETGREKTAGGEGAAILSKMVREDVTKKI